MCIEKDENDFRVLNNPDNNPLKQSIKNFDECIKRFT
jgi:hypothetical protein